MRVKIGVFFLQIDSFREISFHSANSTPTHWLTYFRVTLLVSLRDIDYSLARIFPPLSFSSSRNIYSAISFEFLENSSLDIKFCNCDSSPFLHLSR